jgi:hypothetical protein
MIKLLNDCGAFWIILGMRWAIRQCLIIPIPLRFFSRRWSRMSIQNARIGASNHDKREEEAEIGYTPEYINEIGFISYFTVRRVNGKQGEYRDGDKDENHPVRTHYEKQAGSTSRRSSYGILIGLRPLRQDNHISHSSGARTAATRQCQWGAVAQNVKATGIFFGPGPAGQSDGKGRFTPASH